MRFLKYLIVFIVIIGFFAFLSRKDEPTFQKIKIKETVIKVELADDSPKQIKGLSGKDKLGENSGMFFVYNKPGIRSVWMKDMKFPIDIIWIDENKKIIGIESGVKPESYPKSFESPEPVKYILETNSGLAEKYGFKPGALVDF